MKKVYAIDIIETVFLTLQNDFSQSRKPYMFIFKREKSAIEK